MSYTDLTKRELIFIEKHYGIGLTGRKIGAKLKRGHEAIYCVIRKLDNGFTAIQIYLQY